MTSGTDAEFRRRTIQGILESYHSNYDMLAEGLQNAIDAVEDAKLLGLSAPFRVEVTVNLTDNWIGILDTGVGMTFEEVATAFAPNVSFKTASASTRDRKHMYRGYKGVGLTFLAYGTDDVVIHSKKRDGEVTKAKMRYGRSWAQGEWPDPAVMVEDTEPSPLDNMPRGTFLRVQFSQKTRPRSLVKLARSQRVWETILRTRTAVGQISLGRDVVCPIKTTLLIVQDGTSTSSDIDPTFLYPDKITRTPPLRFLDLLDYYTKHPEQSSPPPEKIRQDGLFLEWDRARIGKQLTGEQRTQFADELETYSPHLYAFVPYQGSVWGDLNQLVL